MAEPTGKYIYISKDLNTRRDPFVYTLRYCESATNHNNVKDALLSDGLTVKTYYDLTPDNSILQTPSQTIAAGFNITGNCVAEIKAAVSSGIPIMIVSEEECFVEFIKYTITAAGGSFECICKLKKTNAKSPKVTCAGEAPKKGQTYSCMNNYEFCQKVESNDKKDENSKIIKDQIDKLIRTSSITKANEGLLPVFRYSQFLDFVIWRNHIGEKIEKVRIDEEINKMRNNLLKSRNIFGS